MPVELDLELHVCNLLCDFHSNYFHQQDGGLHLLVHSCPDPAGDSLSVQILPHKNLAVHTRHSSADGVVPHILSRHSEEPKGQVVQEVLTLEGPPSVQVPQLEDLPFGDEELLLDPLRGLL